jgi:pimeloyl-ACP methyl ester carboxylesterase
VSCYEEFALLPDQARELGLSPDHVPAVRREALEVAPGRLLSALVWGAGPAELVLVHGGAQNAHTWDRVALLLGRPLVAVDLAGHGHSDWRPDRDYSTRVLAADLAPAVRRLAPGALAVVGMSIGGLACAALAGTHPVLVRRLVLVDVTPSARAEAAFPIVRFVHDAPRPATFDQVVDYALAALPGADPVALRRGLLHNLRREEDGSWIWRHHLGSLGEDEVVGVAETFPSLWRDLADSRAPLMLVRGGRSPAVTDADVRELRRLRPDARVEVVEGAGHSVQSDRPERLAELLAQFVPPPPQDGA